MDAATNQKKYIPRVNVRQDRWNKEQGNSNEGRTTRPHARTNAEKQEESIRTELEGGGGGGGDVFKRQSVGMLVKR